MTVKEIIQVLSRYDEDLEVRIYDEDNDYTSSILSVKPDPSNEVDEERVVFVKGY